MTTSVKRMTPDGPLRFSIVTDIHHGFRLGEHREARKLTHMALDLLSDFVDEMNRHVQPDFVAHLGDAIQDADPISDRQHYGEVMKVLGGLDAPVLHVAGNHDLVHMSRDELREMQAVTTAVAATVKGHRLAVLPSYSNPKRCWTVEHEVEVFFTSLEGDGSPLLVFSHQTLADQDLRGNRWFEGLGHECLIESRGPIRQRLQRTGRLRGVFNGHLHWTRLDVEAAVPYVTIQSLVENMAEPGAGAVPAVSWGLVEFDTDSVRIEVFGVDAAQWTLPNGAESIS